MATEILASGTTTASSAERTVAAGAVETLIFRAAGNNPAQCVIEAKGSDSAFYVIGPLGDGGKAKQVSGPIIYRVTRGVGRTASAVDVEA
jgi:hypothetical protein